MNTQNIAVGAMVVTGAATCYLWWKYFQKEKEYNNIQQGLDVSFGVSPQHFLVVCRF
jgi:hypothetical protein